MSPKAAHFTKSANDLVVVGNFAINIVEAKVILTHCFCDASVL